MGTSPEAPAASGPAPAGAAPGPAGGPGRRWGVGLLVAAVLVGAVLSLWWEPGTDPVGAGQPAPGFTLPRLEGEAPVELASLRGRVVLLNFWATWCQPCEAEMPAMERLHRELGSADFTLLAVSVDEDPEAVRAFRDRLGLSFPILLDPRKQVSGAYQTYRYPETFLIDRDGRIVARYIGPRDWDTAAYVDRIRRLVEGRG